MKIGLISINTQVMSLNFACPLHTYAFQQFLLQNGIETTVIDYKPSYVNEFDFKHPLFTYMKRGFSDGFSPEASYENKAYGQKSKYKASMELHRERINHWVDLFHEREIRYEKFREFVEDNYIKTDKCYDWKMLDKEDPGFDCYICVTDVIWKIHANGFDKGFFLACKSMDGKKKIAYSASRGPYYGWNDKQIKEFLSYIQPFDFISVRENSFKEHIESISDKKVEVVLDPVFLQDKEFYHNLAIPPKEKNYVLLYDVMEKATDSIVNAVRFAESKGLQLIEISDRKENAYIPAGTYHEVKYGLGIEEWLGYIEHADYVFTNSFHCCCFAIIFEKELFAGKRNGDKVDMVLNTFGLTERKLTPGVDATTLDFAPIDYAPIREIWKKRKEESAAYILNAIHAVEADFNSENDTSAPPQTAEDKKAKYRLYFHSGASADEVIVKKYKDNDNLVKTAGGAWEYRNKECIDNEIEHPLQRNGFNRKGYDFLGWHGRISVNKQNYWYCTDGAFHSSSEISKKAGLHKYLFKDGAVLSNLPFPIEERTEFSLVMTAEWSKSEPRWTFLSKKEEPAKAETETKPQLYRLYYHSGIAADDLSWVYPGYMGEMRKTPKGTREYRCDFPVDNKVPQNLLRNGFIKPGYVFLGWNGRITVDNQVKWYCTDKEFHTPEEISDSQALSKYLFMDGEEISKLPFDTKNKSHLPALVMEALWVIDNYHILYHSGATGEGITWDYTDRYGTVKKASDGAWIYHFNIPMKNRNPRRLRVNRFSRDGYSFAGWNGRITINGEIWWYCTDGRFHADDKVKTNSKLTKYLFHECEEMRLIPIPATATAELTLEAIWKNG